LILLEERGVGYAVGRENPGALIEVEWRGERKQAPQVAVHVYGYRKK
jgi:hypothetical protein